MVAARATAAPPTEEPVSDGEQFTLAALMFIRAAAPHGECRCRAWA